MIAPVGFMLADTYYSILDQCKPYSIKLNWRGEPLLHPLLSHMVKWAKYKGIHEVSINTNGQLLNKDTAQQLADVGLDWLIISVDGVYKDTYESIRKGGDFKRLVHNIVNTRMLYDELKHSPKIRIQICRQPRNEQEIEKWKEFFGQFADKLRIGKLFDPQGRRRLSIKQPFGCKQLWQRLTISWQGNILPCPSDYLEQCKLGNVSNTTIQEAWQSHRLNYYRKALSQYGRSALSLCSNCSSYC